VLLSDFSKQFTLPACFGLCAKVLVRTQICFSSSSHLALVRFSQLLRFQLFFSSVQYFFWFHIKFVQVHSSLAQDFSSSSSVCGLRIFPPALRSAVPFFPTEKFRFCRRFFPACDSQRRCPGCAEQIGGQAFRSTRSARPILPRMALVCSSRAQGFGLVPCCDFCRHSSCFRFVSTSDRPRFTFRVLCVGLFFAPLRFTVPAHRPILLLSLTAW
jgi:hypothetical protein